MSSEQSSAPVWSAKHLRVATDAAGVALWSWNVDTDAITMDERAFSMWGVPKVEPVTFEDLSAHIHPHDLGRVRAAFAATRPLLGAYDIDFRILVGDEIRWIAARGQGDDDGIVGRIMFGVFLDVTQRKQAEEAHELLAGEMSHRVRWQAARSMCRAPPRVVNWLFCGPHHPSVFLCARLTAEVRV